MAGGSSLASKVYGESGNDLRKTLAECHKKYMYKMIYQTIHWKRS